MARPSFGISRVTVEANNGIVQEFAYPDLIGVSVMVAGAPSIENPGLFPDQCISGGCDEPVTTVLSTIPPREKVYHPPIPVLYEFDFVSLLHEHEDDLGIGLADAIAAVFGYPSASAALDAWPVSGSWNEDWDEDWNWDSQEDDDDE